MQSKPIQLDLHPRLASLLLAGLAAVCFAFGLWVIIDPLSLATYVDLQPAGPQAASELRAMYGGLIIGFGVIQWRGFRSPSFGPAAIEATGWIFAGVALGRLTGLLTGLLSGPFAGLQPVFLVGELGLAAGCAYLLRTSTRPTVIQKN